MHKYLFSKMRFQNRDTYRDSFETDAKKTRAVSVSQCIGSETARQSTKNVIPQGIKVSRRGETVISGARQQKSRHLPRHFRDSRRVIHELF